MPAATAPVRPDGVPGRRGPQTWQPAGARSPERTPLQEARHHATNASTKGFTKEELVAYQFLKQAIHRKRLKWVHLFGFEKPDILYYLPVGEFVSDATSWEELTRQRRRKKDGSMENVKAVIKRLSGRPVNARQVKKAARAMDEIPREFTDLLNVSRSVPGTASK
jgi:hypothetical protein